MLFNSCFKPSHKGLIISLHPPSSTQVVIDRRKYPLLKELIIMIIQAIALPARTFPLFPSFPPGDSNDSLPY